MQTSQQISNTGNEERLRFYQPINRLSLDVNTIIFSDESDVYLNGYINKQTFRNWSSEKPVKVLEKPLHSQRCQFGATYVPIKCIGHTF